MTQPRLVFVIAAGYEDTNRSINQEIAVVNYFMTCYPQVAFICRGSQLLVELASPRPAREWAEFYMRLLECSDALYCHDGNRRHPLADHANDLGIPILDDQMDVELWLASTTTG